VGGAELGTRRTGRMAGSSASCCDVPSNRQDHPLALELVDMVTALMKGKKVGQSKGSIVLILSYCGPKSID